MAIMKGIPVVLSGPSGVGKNTVANIFLENCPDVVRSISMTTRPPRPGEREQVDYYFVDQPHFEQAIDNRELIEWAQVYQHYYGTPKSFLDNQFEMGKDVLLLIDVQGAAAIRNRFKNRLLVYLVPPSMEELIRRLHNRDKGKDDDLEHRYNEAVHEMKFLDMFDYVVINDHPQQAAKDLYTIVLADRYRRERMSPFLQEFGLIQKNEHEE